MVKLGDQLDNLKSRGPFQNIYNLKDLFHNLMIYPIMNHMKTTTIP